MGNFKGILFFLICIIISVLIIVLDFFWTKSSLEDVAGKEVKTSTVIWAMIKNNSNK